MDSVIHKSTTIVKGEERTKWLRELIFPLTSRLRMNGVIFTYPTIIKDSKTREAIEHWFEQGEAINLALRNKSNEYSDTANELIRLVHLVRAEDEFTLYRGCEWFRTITEATRSNSFVSLTASKDVADRFGPVVPVRITKGTPIFYISATDSVYEEDEFLIYKALIERDADHIIIKE